MSGSYSGAGPPKALMRHLTSGVSHTDLVLGWGPYTQECPDPGYSSRKLSASKKISSKGVDDLDASAYDIQSVYSSMSKV